MDTALFSVFSYLGPGRIGDSRTSWSLMLEFFAELLVYNRNIVEIYIVGLNMVEPINFGVCNIFEPFHIISSYVMRSFLGKDAWVPPVHSCWRGHHSGTMLSGWDWQDHMEMMGLVDLLDLVAWMLQFAPVKAKYFQLILRRIREPAKCNALDPRWWEAGIHISTF